MFRVRLSALALSLVVVSACAQRGGSADDTGDSAGMSDSAAAPGQRAGGGGGGGGMAGDPGAQRAEVARLEARVREIAKAGGCTQSGQCKTAPVGERACGGPRDYVVYCPLSTDEAALEATVDSLKRAEMRLNEMEGIISTCEYRMPPDVELVGGSCRAKGR